MAIYMIAVVDDLFFTSMISEKAKQAGVQVSYAKGKADLIELVEARKPDKIIFDLNNAKADPIASVKEVKKYSSFRGVKLIGFLHHTQLDLKRQALEAGFDWVMPKLDFSRNLEKILTQ